MFDTLKSRIYQGEQFIKDIQNAQMRSQFRGLPKLCNSNCNSCAACLNVCPTGALKLNPLSIDMGKCTFCGACKNVCKTGAIDFSNFYKLSATSADKLVITEDMTEEEFSKVAIEVKKEIKKVFGKSL